MRIGIIFLSMLSLLLTAAQPDFYVWQRKHTPEVQAAVTEVLKFSESRLYFLAGELEQNGRVTIVSPAALPEAVFSRATPVIRIHIRHLDTPAAQLAAKITALYRPWQKCKALQIDLDAPESKIDYYTQLMQELRKRVPGVTLSATVLPCHVKHKTEFRKLAQVCDFYVLQIHGLEKRDGNYSLVDKKTTFSAIANAVNLKRPFKLALPAYCYNIENRTIKPDMDFIGKIAKFSDLHKFRVIFFRLGISSDGEALSFATVQELCKTGKYTPDIQHEWQYSDDGSWYLYIKNCGSFAEKVSLEMKWQDGFVITDADTFNNAEFSFDRKTLDLTLPPDGESKPFLWLRTPAAFDSSQSPLTITRKDTAAK